MRSTVFIPGGLVKLGCLVLFLSGITTLLYVFRSVFCGKQILTCTAWHFNSAGYPTISHPTATEIPFSDGGPNASSVISLDKARYPSAVLLITVLGF